MPGAQSATSASTLERLRALRLHVLVEQSPAGPALEQNHPVGVVQTFEQLVLLAAFFLLRDRLQGLEGAGKVSCLARRDLDHDNVPNSHRSSSEATRCSTAETRTTSQRTSLPGLVTRWKPCATTNTDPNGLCPRRLGTSARATSHGGAGARI
jgi:hypothetical protein